MKAKEEWTPLRCKVPADPLLVNAMLDLEMVSVPSLGIRGRITGILFEYQGLRYRVRYACDGKFRSEWAYADEIVRDEGKEGEHAAKD